MTGILLVCALMALLGVWLPLPIYAPGNCGIALPSPNLWPILPLWGEIINVALTFICGGFVYFINKQFSLIRTGQPLGAAFFLPLSFASLPTGSHFVGTPIVLLLVLTSLATVFNTFRSRNATRPVFFAATCLSVGSMFEYAFIPLALALFLSCFVMEIMRPKEFIAFGLGIISPYWVGIGLGLIDPLAMRLPMPHMIFSGGIAPAMLPPIIIIGVIAFLGWMLSLYNRMIIYSGNTRVRRSIMVINIFGTISALAMAFDIDNIPAYLGVMNVWIAIQLANLFTLRDIRRVGLTFWLIQLAIVLLSLSFVYYSYVG